MFMILLLGTLLSFF
uniref:Uncharacterized protein n=1 Tax=Rhizophora mucronata TaxID=61149 RepID=A0A2P2NLX1_RHIMU